MMMEYKFIYRILFFVVTVLPFSLFSQDENLKVVKKGINIGAQNHNSTHGGFVNIRDLEVLKLSEASSKTTSIDFIYTYGQKTGINILTPASSSMGSFGASYKHASEIWNVKNRGTLIYLQNTKENRSLYRSIKSNVDLEKAFEKSLINVKQLDDYKRTLHGPNSRISSLSMGDYFIFKSNSGRGYAMGRIVDFIKGYQGHIRVDLLATQFEK